jgi:hypothetical protein
MPIYDFQCIGCSQVTTEILPVGTTAARCSFCGDFAVLIPSIPAKAVIRPGATSRDEGFLAPLPRSSQAGCFSEDDNAVRVYDFEFGNYEKERLNTLVDKELQSGVSDGYCIS